MCSTQVIGEGGYMKKFKVGDRVIIPSLEFLSAGSIIRILKGMNAVIVKLDERAPNEYAGETDEVLMWMVDIEEEVYGEAKSI